MLQLAPMKLKQSLVVDASGEPRKGFGDCLGWFLPPLVTPEGVPHLLVTTLFVVDALAMPKW